MILPCALTMIIILLWIIIVKVVGAHRSWARTATAQHYPPWVIFSIEMPFFLLQPVCVSNTDNFREEVSRASHRHLFYHPHIITYEIIEDRICGVHLSRHTYIVIIRCASGTIQALYPSFCLFYFFTEVFLPLQFILEPTLRPRTALYCADELLIVWQQNNKQ